MIKCNNFKSIRLFLAFILLFFVIMTCALNPCRVLAAGSTNPSANPEGEKIATFDEDEKATFNQEQAATTSTLLHGEHYQPSVYFPERQKRSVTSHKWMHIIPFFALVLLALATSRFFRRRRQKSGLVVSSAEGTYD